MAQPPPYPPYQPPYTPPRPQGGWNVQSPAALVGLLVFFAVFVIVIVVILTGVMSMGAGFPIAFAAPFCGIFLFVIIMVVVLVATGMGRYSSRIPPPPPIQQPMVPAGTQGPVSLNCPNCGAPPQNVDRFGVATCTYCNTRFLVR